MILITNTNSSTLLAVVHNSSNKQHPLRLRCNNLCQNHRCCTSTTATSRITTLAVVVLVLVMTLLLNPNRCSDGILSCIRVASAFNIPSTSTVASRTSSHYYNYNTFMAKNPLSAMSIHMHQYPRPTCMMPTTTSSSIFRLMSARSDSVPSTASATTTTMTKTMDAKSPSAERSDTKHHDRKIPVILLSGFLGSGKTSALQHILHNTDHQMQLGILVNDVAAINIDAKFIAMTNPTEPTTTATTSSSSSSLSNDVNRKYEVIELQNGCACCSLQDDFLLSMERMIQNRRRKVSSNQPQSLSSSPNTTTTSTTTNMFDAIIVELSGVADPAAIQNNWKSIMTTNSGSTATSTESNTQLFPDLTTHCAPDLRIVTIVDACTFGTDYMTWDVIGERPIWVTTDNVDECNERRKVSELLVEQVEAAQMVLINKIDIATPEQQTVSTLVVQALNANAEIIPVQYGKIVPQQLFGRTMSNENDRDVLPSSSPCTDTKCTDPTHSHSHSQHDHDTTTTSAHSHEHEHHADDGTACQDPTCTDPSHSHNHDHNTEETRQQRKDTSTDALGFVNFVYKANRPFHTERIMSTLSQWPVPIKDTLDLGTLQLNDNAPYEIDGALVVPTMSESSNDLSPFMGVLRSKGFCWFAPQKWMGATQDAWRHDTAMYWSHAGRQFGISTAGKWWATMTNPQMEKYFNGNEVEYERIQREDFVSDEFGDRRQEIVFIGTRLNVDDITDALNACLLTDKEMDYYRQKLQNFMDAKMYSTNARRTATSGGLFDVDTINHTDLQSS